MAQLVVCAEGPSDQLSSVVMWPRAMESPGSPGHCPHCPANAGTTLKLDLYMLVCLPFQLSTKHVQ